MEGFHFVPLTPENAEEIAQTSSTSDFREVGRFTRKTNGGEYPFVRMALDRL